MDNNNSYSKINIPDFEALYKKDAEFMLKMINEEMEKYYKLNQFENVDILNIHQIIRKLQKFSSNTPGIESLKLELIEDLRTLIKHYESELSEKNAILTREINKIRDEIEKLTKQNNLYVIRIVLFQWYLYKHYKKGRERLKDLQYQLNLLQNKDLSKKRIRLNTEQLIRISHGFREKYLNISAQTSQNETEK